MIKVVDGLYRGPRPTDMSVLKDMQIDVVINLESGVYDFFHDGECVHGTPDRMIHLHIPISSWALIQREQVAKAAAVAKRALEQGLRVYIHCLHGEDRTGIVCAAFQIAVNGWILKSARTQMYALGFHRFPYFYWERVLASFVGGL